ncbi:MAG: hypothetical protein N2248_05925 [candidate division WOR-3 bacterium]|nr:hypothetical protein [candidate division WOR-3 bacterium]
MKPVFLLLGSSFFIGLASVQLYRCDWQIVTAGDGMISCDYCETAKILFAR